MPDDAHLTAVLGAAADALRVSSDDGVVTVELHRPERRNAVTLAMWEALGRLMPALAADDDVEAVVLRGTPGGPFSAGADISEFPTLRRAPADAERYSAAVDAGEGALLAFPKPTVALVQGWAVGGGTQLAAACDLRVCDASARFAVTPAALGVVYALPSTARLVDVVGTAWASFLLLTGEQVDAATALRIGLVHEVTADVEARAYALARTCAGRAQVSVAGAKRLLARATAGERNVDDEVQELYRAAWASPEYAEGVEAFLAKRPPDFRSARAAALSPSASA
jgi:enoyl-CoA hydratase/carnithine racemase